MWVEIKYLGRGNEKGQKRQSDISRDASDPVSTRSKRVNDSDARRSVAKRRRHDELTFPGHGANRSERCALDNFAGGNFNARKRTRYMCIYIYMFENGMKYFNNFLNNPERNFLVVVCSEDCVDT